MNPNETQIDGTHYRARIQHWDYVFLVLDNRYLEGNVTKYVVRHKKKNGTKDLEKALHYIDKLIDTHRKGHYLPMAQVSRWTFRMEEFIRENDLDTSQALVVDRITMWRGQQDLAYLRELIAQMLAASRRADAKLEARKAGATASAITEFKASVEPQPRGYVDQD